MSFTMTPPTTPGNVGLGVSLVAHVSLMALLVFGLPKKELPPAPPPPIIVDLVTISDKTRSPVKAPRDQIAKKIADTVSPPPPPKPADTKPVEPEKKPEPVKPDPKPEPKKVEAPKPEKVPEKKPEPAPKIEKAEPKKEEPKPVPPPAPTVKKKPEPVKKDPPKKVTKKPETKKKPVKKVKESPDFSEMIRKSINENKSKSLAAGAGQKATAGTRELGEMLTISQMDAVRQHISRCWNVAAIMGAPGLEKIVVNMKLTMRPDRTVKSLTVISGEGRGSPYYKRMVETIERAFERPGCQQLPLPPGKYSSWKEFKLKFSLAAMLGY